MLATVPSSVLLVMLVDRELPSAVSVPTCCERRRGANTVTVEADTPRDGSRRRPFQQDATRFRGDAADSCGETLGVSTLFIRVRGSMLTYGFRVVITTLRLVLPP